MNYLNITHKSETFIKRLDATFWCVLLFILNLYDAVATSFIIALMGPESEVNPIMRAAWYYTPTLFWSLKLLFSLTIPILLYNILCHSKDNKSIIMIKRLLISINVFYIILTIFHISVFYRIILSYQN